MPSLKKSEVIKNVLRTLLSISSRKTDLPFTIMTLADLIRRLESRYRFLKHIQIKNDFYNEESDDMISVMSDINSVPPTELGQALHSIIDSMNRSLGDDAGHFFIKEIRNKLSDEYITEMRGMGVDLGLMQLESEIYRLEREITERKNQSEK
jgi:SOS-response transcriptional repressor LexA